MFKNTTIKTKLLSIIISTIVIITAVISLESIYSINQLNEKNIQKYKEEAYSAKETELKNYVSVAKKTMEAYYERTSKEQLAGIEQINDAVASLDQQTQQIAMVASQTNDIATETDAIAKLVVSNVDEKEFIGKDSIKAKNTSTQPKVSKKVETTKTKSQIRQPVSNTKSITPITSTSTKDEWASF